MSKNYSWVFPPENVTPTNSSWYMHADVMVQKEIGKLIDRFSSNRDTFDSFVSNCRDTIYNIMRKTIDGNLANRNVKITYNLNGDLSLFYSSLPSIERGAIYRPYVVHISSKRAISKMRRCHVKSLKKQEEDNNEG